MTDEDGYPLEDVADRLRRARTEPQWSSPGPGTWEAIAAATGAAPGPAPAGPRPRRPVGRREVLAAVGGLIVGGAAGALLTRDGGAGEAIRRAVLTPLDAPDRELGRAELLRRAVGYSLEVDVPGGVSNPGGYVEVWLINTDLTRMISVGVFAADEVGRFTVDDALVDAGYLIVDLSNEPFDDEPRHSGDTIMRGELRA